MFSSKQRICNTNYTLQSTWKLQSTPTGPRCDWRVSGRPFVLISGRPTPTRWRSSGTRFLWAKRPYHCPYCEKTFKTEGELKRHVRIHTGAKPYSCRHCSERFTQHIQLKSHLLKSHNEGTWHTCDICEKKFVTLSCLQKHWRRHEVVKPCVCRVWNLTCWYTQTTNSSAAFFVINVSNIKLVLNITSTDVLIAWCIMMQPADTKRHVHSNRCAHSMMHNDATCGHYTSCTQQQMCS